MKATSSLSVAAALLITGVAFAQTPSSNNSDVSQSNSPATNTPSKATDANGATSPSVSAACKKQASDKKLSGDDKTKFMSDCNKGKTTRSGN